MEKGWKGVYDASSSREEGEERNCTDLLDALRSCENQLTKLRLQLEVFIFTVNLSQEGITSAWSFLEKYWKYLTLRVQSVCEQEHFQSLSLAKVKHSKGTRMAKPLKIIFRSWTSGSLLVNPWCFADPQYASSV